MQGKVWGVLSAETGELVLYPREHPPLIKVSADVAALWHEVAVSNTIDCSVHRSVAGHSAVFRKHALRNPDNDCQQAIVLSLSVQAA